MTLQQADEVKSTEDLKVVLESTGEVLHQIPMLATNPAPPTEMEGLMMVSKHVFAVVLIALFMFFEFNMLKSLENSRRYARSTLMLTLRDVFILLMPLWLTVLGALHQNSMR